MNNRVDAFTGMAEAAGEIAGIWYRQGRYQTLNEAIDAAVVALTKRLTEAGSDIPSRAVAAHDIMALRVGTRIRQISTGIKGVVTRLD